MREILFRGKRERDGEWEYGDLWCNPYGKRAVCIVSPINDQGTTGGNEVLHETVGQFTGLTDKNGVKIFEGDIIQSLESSVTGLVQWFPEHSAFMVWCKSANEVGFLYECADIIKVIGNIHDNPELLEGGNNNG